MINTYAQYWNYIDFITQNSRSIEELRQNVITQSILSDSNIKQHHLQHLHYTTDTALYLDALTGYKQKG